MKLPAVGLEAVRLVRRPGMRILDEEREGAVIAGCAASGGEVDQPVGAGDDIEGVGFGLVLVGRLQQPSVELGEARRQF